MNSGSFRMRLSFLISLWGLLFFSWPILVFAEPVLLPLGADIQSIIEKQERIQFTTLNQVCTVVMKLY